ncbi:MAG TPA: hypothetical protein H9688_04120 [Firmicutes bacterium]|nr:hypothetical protein [Bacillota bacterium]
MDDNKQNAEPAGTAVSTAEDNSQNYYENKNYDNYDTFDYMEEAKRINTREEPSTAAKVALILIAVYFNVIGAIIGIIVGAVYMGKEGAGYKSYGRMLLIVSIVFLVIDILMFIVLASAVYNVFSMLYYYY